MIRDFHYAPTEAEISKYSGYMAASFAFCQFLFAVHWGKTSDKIGRKPVLIIGLIGTSACLLVFGFSKNFYTAFAARAIAGALNGNTAVLRTTIGEICVEKRHQALGFSTLPLLFSLGSVIGPLIGGSPYLTAPPKKSPYKKIPTHALEFSASSTLSRFREQHPYALSNIVVATILWCSCIIGILFLEETNDKFKRRRDIGLEIGDAILRRFGVDRPHRTWKSSKLDEETPLITVVDNSAEIATGSANSHDAAQTHSTGDEEPAPIPELVDNQKDLPHSTSASSVNSVAKESRLSPRVVSAIISNCIISLHNMSYNEFLPVFLAAPLHPDQLKFPLKIVGGFGLDTSTIGKLFSSTGLMGIIIIILIFPWIDRHWSTLCGYRFSLSIFPIVYLLVPMAVFTLQKFNATFPSWLTVLCLYALTSLKMLAQATGLPQVMILTHRAASKSNLAYVNSVALSMVALSRCIGPIAFGYIMTLGDNYKVAWLPWWVMALLAFAGFAQTLFMTDYED